MPLPEQSSQYAIATAVIVTACSSVWLSLVSDYVPEPYLDEVFHVPQAQAYCSGDFITWDPKITTPPGLYLLSYGLSKLLGRCDLQSLRLSNTLCLSLVGLVAFYLAKRVHSLPAPRKSPWALVHTAINICLFPPVFFYSALYYTDIASLLFVLLSYQTALQNIEKATAFSAVLQVFYGLLALLMRQTNVFWVALFPSGLAVLKVYQGSGKPISKDGLEVVVEDYAQTAIGMIQSCLSQFVPLVSRLIVPATLAASFASFVLLNGSVVLGDKTQHVATIHTPQMLYIWPYIVFFSFPLIGAYFFLEFSGARSSQIYQRVYQLIPRAGVLVLLAAGATAAVKYNTIIHPFTLADNRHYVFYVFRYLRYSWVVKFLVIPCYLVCGLCALTPMHGVDTGFTIVWLVCSGLSLVTTPLVEPRYFIVPWVVWRIKLVGSYRSSINKWLWLETLWFVAINAITGYVFLVKTFGWPEEPGRKQRFMW